MSNQAARLPIPSHFDPHRVGEIWQVPYLDLASAAESWAEQHNVAPAATDRRRTSLVLIDTQITFCIPGAELFVAGRSGRGAVEDNVRLCSFIYENLSVITEINATLDTHTAMQIFHPVFWVNEAGEHPAPHTEISVADVDSGVWKVNPAVAKSVGDGSAETLERHAQHYVRRLAASGKYPLIIWPYHAMLGGTGHALVPAVEAACFFHSIARSSQTVFEAKGDNPLTESYSVLGAEVLDHADGVPLADKNTRLIERLLGFDVLIVAGQAKSHCVAWTIADLLEEIMARDEHLAKRVYLLEDCTSPVVVPDVVDFTERADVAFQRFVSAGMHAVRSTTPIQEWPGIGL
jgi:nicotinamidase-related amidase